MNDFIKPLLPSKIPFADLENLVHFEVCCFLKKIYAKANKYGLKPVYPLAVKIRSDFLSFLSPFSWDIKLNSPEKVKTGRVGRIFLRRDWALIRKLRKKAAAYIACEWYLFYLYANKNKLETISGFKNIAHRRPHLVKHLLNMIGEQKWIYVGTKAVVEIQKSLKKADAELASFLGMGAENMKQIEALLSREKKHLDEEVKTLGLDKKLDFSTIEKTDIMIQTEIDEIGRAIILLKKERQLRMDEKPKVDFSEDIKHLDSIRRSLQEIQQNIHLWEYSYKKEHKRLSKAKIDAHSLSLHLDRELKQLEEGIKIDSRKVHLLLEEFDLEKSRIIGKIRNINYHLYLGM